MIWQETRVLVTGGAGFIGSHLVEKLLQKGAEVIILDDFSSGNHINIKQFIKNEKLMVVEADVKNYLDVEKCVKDIDCIFHCAALVGVIRAFKEPIKVLEVNIQGTRNILEAARKNDVERIISASSSEVYGDTGKIPNSENHSLVPVTAYGVSKMVDESYCNAYRETYGLKTTCIRYFNVYGPRQDFVSRSWVIPNFIINALNGKPLRIHGSGNQTRDFTYIEDAVNGTILSAEKIDVIGNSINIGTGKETSINELAMAILKLMGIKNGLKRVHVAPRDFDIKRRCADISKARSIGFKPTIDLINGLQRTIDFYKNTLPQNLI